MGPVNPIVRLVTGLVLAGVLTMPASALDADPRADYRVTSQHGPWMICVTSYTGESAQKLATDLVLEIRSRFNLPALLFSRGEEQRSRRQAELDQDWAKRMDYLKQMGVGPEVSLPQRRARRVDQYAVLVGGYADSETARKVLDKVKKLDPPTSVPLDITTVIDPTAKDAQSAKTKQERINPFHGSFVVRNPAISAPANNQHADPFLKKLNADESYSLLQCPKRLTLVIMEFGGASTYQDKDGKGKSQSVFGNLLGRPTVDMLDASARQAHEVARVMREMKFEAYVLHMRHCSLVTVGGFDSPNDPHLAQTAKMLTGFEIGPFKALPPDPMEIPKFGS